MERDQWLYRADMLITRFKCSQNNNDRFSVVEPSYIIDYVSGDS